MPKPEPLKYREAAIADFNAIDQVDQLIQIVPPKAWIALYTFYILLACLLFWGFFGSIPTRVQGRGVLLVEHGSIYNAVSPPGGGRIENLAVEVGDIIQKDQVVAYLKRPDLAQKVALTTEYVNRLQQELAGLQVTRDKELQIREKNLAEQKATLEGNLETENKNLTEIEALLKLKNDNFKKGLVVLQDIENTRRDYYASKKSIEQLQIDLTRLQTQEDDFKEQWRQQINNKETTLRSQQHELENMNAELEVSKTVHSPATGIVISVNASIGKMVPDGSSIISIASLGEGLDAVVYMAPNEGQRVKPDMEALITPAIIEKEEYGSMKGRVLSVSTFPEASEAIIALLHNEELTKQFVTQGAPIAIRVRIERDPHTFSGYKWTSSDGPALKILPGMLADIRITVREQPPFSLIIPTFKKLLGVS